MTQIIQIETVHQWAQALPLKDNVLVCIGCEQRRPIGNLEGVLPCAEARKRA